MRTQFSVGLNEGDVIDGRYRVEKLLGKGGMGAVYAARHLQLCQRVAIKVLLPEMLAYPEVVERFARESRASVQIKSEHVARVFDVGTLPTGSPYIVMEYLEGTDLADREPGDKPMPVELAVDFLLQACEAIAEAHHLGIIHRDLKPENLFCVKRPDGGLSIKVLDFGVSKMGLDLAGAGAQKLTGLGILGTPLYASPEQLAFAGGVDARSDIWALGVVLYTLLTRRVPFRNQAAIMLYGKSQGEEPTALQSHRPDVPPGLQKVVEKCLGRTPDLRYANVAELAEALLPFAPAHCSRSVERIFGVLGLTPKASALASQPGPGDPGTRPALDAGTRRGRQLLIGLVVLGALGGSSWLVFGSHRGASGSGNPAPSATATVRSAVVAPSSTPPVAATPSVSANVVLIPVFSNQPAAAVASLPPPPDPPPAATTAPRAVPQAPAAAARPVPVGKKVNCNPPYSLDDKGRKHFKPECFAE